MSNIKKETLAGLRKEVLADIKKNYKSIEEFCWENNINKATISNFLNAKKDFRVSTLEKIAAAIDKELEIRAK